MLRTGLTARFSAGLSATLSAKGLCATATPASAAKARPARAASRRVGIRMAPNVVRVLGQNRGKNAALRPMIRVARQKLMGPVDLLGEHGASQQVRPGHGPERQREGCFLQHRLAVAVGATDQEGNIGALVAPAPQVPGEAFAVHNLAAAV